MSFTAARKFLINLLTPVGASNLSFLPLIRLDNCLITFTDVVKLFVVTFEVFNSTPSSVFYSMNRNTVPVSPCTRTMDTMAGWEIVQSSPHKNFNLFLIRFNASFRRKCAENN
jgi:hypothetical protein